MGNENIPHPWIGLPILSLGILPRFLRGYITMIESTNVSQSWAEQILKNTTQEVSVRQHPTHSERRDLDGHLIVFAGHFKMRFNVRACGNVADDVHIHAPHNQRRLRMARRLMDILGIEYSECHVGGFTTLAIGQLKREKIQFVSDLLAMAY